MSNYMGLASNMDILVAQRVEDHAVLIRDLQDHISANYVQAHEAIKALSIRLARIEEQLGITEPVVVPGD